MEKEYWLKKIEGIVEGERRKILEKAEPRLRDLLKGVPVKVFTGEDGKLYGDYFGTPYPHESPFNGYSFPSDINIYAISYRYLAKNGRALRKKIRMVLIHEYGHYLGLKEHELRERGLY